MNSSPALLRAFRHPLLIFSILVLLLNDHLLKAAAPSFLTGKLSDFAGLFFFPFLAGAALQSLARLARRRLGPRPALLASFGLCAALFIPLKTLPGANALASGLLSSLFASPVRVTLDPTDLAALVMFLPAWGLWRHIERGTANAAPGRLAYAALGLGALASLATSPCMTVPSIQRLAQTDGVLYAGILNYNNNAAGGYSSQDGGQTWTILSPEALAQLPTGLQNTLGGPAMLPITLCDPLQPQTCYRIDGRPQVEQSLDGGTTWQVAWRVPLERMDYILRASRGGWPLGCGKTPDLKTYDMLFLPGQGKSTLVVAVGNDGLVLHSPSTDWQRLGIQISQGSYGQAAVTPTSWAASSGDQAFMNIQPEWLLALLAGFLSYLGLSIWAWIFAARHPWAQASRKPGWVFRPLWVLVPWILLTCVSWSLINGALSPATNALSTILLILDLTLPLGILFASVVMWRRAGALVAHPGVFRRQGWRALLAGVVFFAAAWVCLALWAFGVIVAYNTALILATLVGIAGVIFCIVWMRRGLLRSVDAETFTTEAQRH